MLNILAAIQKTLKLTKTLILFRSILELTNNTNNYYL